MKANHLTGIGCFKRMKAHVIQHVEQERDTMFEAATKESENLLKAALDSLELYAETKAEEIVAQISKDYSALLVEQDIFKAVSTARGEIRNLLSQVDARFEKALLPLAEPRTLKFEEGAEADIDYSAAAATRAGRIAAMAVCDSVLVKTEPLIF